MACSNRAFEIDRLSCEARTIRGVKTSSSDSTPKACVPEEASGSLRSCTARASPVPVKSSCNRSSALRRPRKDTSKCWRPAPKSVRAQTQSLPRLPLRRSAIDYDLVEVIQPDTAQVPNSGPTVASRTCMIVGKLVESAVLGLKQTLVGSGLIEAISSRRRNFKQRVAITSRSMARLKSFSQYQPPPNVHWDDEKYQGDAYGAFAWAVYVAEVSYDPLTYEAHVDDFVAVQEVGRVINPVLAAGQIEGGVAQAIGMTLYENVVWQNGRMANGQMTNYIMPTSADIPPIRVYFEENPYAFGPAGAKGIGELPMDGPAPAILNAIENATGLTFNRIPLMPEEIAESLKIDSPLTGGKINRRAGIFNQKNN